MKRSTGRRQGLISLIGAIILLTSVLIIFGKKLIEERLHDMEGLLEYSSRQKLNDRTFLITSKIHLLKKRMERPRETKQDFLNEFKAQRILAMDNRSEKKTKQNNGTIFTPLTALIRKLMGKSSLVPKSGRTTDPLLESAYLTELSRNYLKAAGLFEKVITAQRYKNTIKNDYIRLHIGFCLTMAGNFKESRKQYARLLKKGKESELKTLAIELIDFTITSEIKIDELGKKRISNLDRAEEHLRLHNIPIAITLIKKHLKSPAPVQKDRALYLLGQCREESGKIKQAIMAYTDVLLIDMDSYWARMANRRLFIIGQIYYKNRRISDLAVKNSRTRYKEEDLFKKVASILKEDTHTPDRKAPLSAKITERLTRLNKTKRVVKIIIPAAFKTQVQILSRRYTIIRMISMKNGMRIVGSILKSTPDSLKLATVNGVASLPRKEIINSVILFKK